MLAGMIKTVGSDYNPPIQEPIGDDSIERLV